MRQVYSAFISMDGGGSLPFVLSEQLHEVRFELMSYLAQNPAEVSILPSFATVSVM